MTTTDIGPMNERRDHVARATFPWRTEHLTECGRELSDVAAFISRDQLLDRIKEHGQQRTAFTICMTCWSTAASHKENWETNPVAVMYRETQRAGAALAAPRPDAPERVALTAELRAIAALIHAHPDEFTDFITGLAQAHDIDDARRKRKARSTPRTLTR
ncbi:hypothetical protein [Mycobacteroides abscessus]|uniref:hypothetical protein n=1 Tax=Mycobacteroides abscessus TaxID=36809 RepID=UPI0021031D2E|nr:hypothetical protein [Mycobacteroides abscessus]